MVDVEPNFKVKVECPCGCGLFGTPVAKAFKDGTRHIKGCGKTGKCAQCRGRKSRRSGLDAQRRAAKGLGVPMVSSLRPSDEEVFPGTLRVESKSGAIVRPLFTSYLKAEAQSEAQRPHGDVRPFVFAARVQPDSKDGLIILRESRLQETVYSLAVQLGLIEP